MVCLIFIIIVIVIIISFFYKFETVFPSAKFTDYSFHNLLQRLIYFFTHKNIFFKVVAAVLILDLY